MNKIQYFFLSLFLIFAALPVLAQHQSIGIGEWQLHLPNNNAKAVADAGDRIYCATETGFFYYDKEFNNLVTLSKTDGFNDVNISTIRFDEATNTLLIAYENSNIDLVQNGTIININDIFRKPMVGVKTIHHIYFHNKFAYLSCSFGVVVLDLQKHEVKDTYGNLGSGGSAVKVYASTILNDSIYLATSEGILNARVSNTNLLDFNNWNNISAGLPPLQSWDPYRTIASFNNKVYAGYNDKNATGGVYVYNSSNWAKTPVPDHGDYLSLQKGDENLLLASTHGISFINKTGQVNTITHTLLENPYDIIKGKEGAYWVADYQNGLLKYENQQFTEFTPNGPAYTNAFSIYPDKDGVYVVSGGYASNYAEVDNFRGFYLYRNGDWENFNIKEYPDPQQYPRVQFLTDVVRNPVNNKLYFTSYGFGLIEWSGLGNYKIYDDRTPGVTLQSSIPTSPGFVRLTSVTTDARGNVWMINRRPEFANSPGLHLLRPDGSWQAFQMPGFKDQNNLEHLVIDDLGNKWITVSDRPETNGGVVVFDDTNNRYVHLNTNPESGALPAKAVHAIAKDHDGAIWLGTSNGIAIFYSPSQVFSSTVRPAARPIIDGRYLLEGQQAKVIAVDGGNRKWIGTNNGVWLFNEDGDELIYHFTTKNSPLPADNIQSLAINHATGEVFVGTEAGIAVYRSGATITEGEPDCAKVFPNPVRAEFTGKVGISGVPNNAIVKITDITGALVYETKAEGGTASWNVTDYNGRRVNSGVYLVFSSTPDGEQTCISKIAVVE